MTNSDTARTESRVPPTKILEDLYVDENREAVA
jgi:hypothetical protein